MYLPADLVVRGCQGLLASAAAAVHLVPHTLEKGLMEEALEQLMETEKLFPQK
jgi:hypothetical protein